MAEQGGKKKFLQSPNFSTRPGLVCKQGKKKWFEKRSWHLRSPCSFFEKILPLILEVDDESKLFATQTDGMWFRQSFVELKSQVALKTLEYMIHWTIPIIPDGFERDGIYLCTAPGESLLYFLPLRFPHGQMPQWCALMRRWEIIHGWEISYSMYKNQCALIAKEIWHRCLIKFSYRIKI